jgi:hypothetical protein
MAVSDRTISNTILYTENGEAIYPAGPVYSASAVGITGVASATDIFTITGSATKVVRVHNLYLTGTLASAAVRDVLLVKRSTANSGGTATTQTAISLDSNSAAASAVVRAYTANPTLGTPVGTVRVRRVGVPTSTASNIDVANFEFTVPLVLRGTSQVLAINLNGVAASVVWSAFIEWSED